MRWFTGFGWGAHASPRAISGVSPETLLGETPNSTRETRMLPFSFHLRESESSADSVQNIFANCPKLDITEALSAC